MISSSVTECGQQAAECPTIVLLPCPWVIGTFSMLGRLVIGDFSTAARLEGPSSAGSD